MNISRLLRWMKTSDGRNVMSLPKRPQQKNEQDGFVMKWKGKETVLSSEGGC